MENLGIQFSLKLLKNGSESNTVFIAKLDLQKGYLNHAKFRFSECNRWVFKKYKQYILVNFVQLLNGKRKNEEDPQRLDQRKGKKKQERQISCKKLGRPEMRGNEEDDFEISQDNTEQIYGIIIRYLQAIGLLHGLIFRPKDRKLMNDKATINQIQWKEFHQWLEDQQKKKIQKKIEEIFTQEDGFFIFGHQIAKDVLENLYLKIGSVVADQATEELYYLVTEILKIINEYDQRIVQKTINQCYEKCMLFNAKYFIQNKITIQYHIKIKGNIKEKFKLFFKQFKNGISNILWAQCGSKEDISE